MFGFSGVAAGDVWAREGPVERVNPMVATEAARNFL
jgi:hypothetical protein